MKIGTTRGSNGGQKLRFWVEVYENLYKYEGQKKITRKLYKHGAEFYVSKVNMPQLN